MIDDPAFGIAIALPLAILAVAAAFRASAGRVGAIAMAILSVAAFAVGCGHPSEGTTSTAGGTPPPVAVSANPHMTVFSAARAAAARHATNEGDVSIDVYDARQNGSQNLGGASVGKRQTLYVIGWAYVRGRNAPCDAIGLLVDGTNVFPGRYGFARPDVASYYKEPARSNTGYVIEVPANRLRPGEHKANVVCVAGTDVARTNGPALKLTVGR
jgi:hypothetical protein